MRSLVVGVCHGSPSGSVAFSFISWSVNSTIIVSWYCTPVRFPFPSDRSRTAVATFPLKGFIFVFIFSYKFL